MYYLLSLKLAATLPADVRALYIEAVAAHNKSIDESDYFNAGFDLICPQAVEVAGLSMVKMDLGVCGAMGCVLTYGDDDYSEDASEADAGASEADAGGSDTSGDCCLPVGYFLHPRSSTGTKTPLRLANSVGIIDAGYRGNYIAAFDNIRAPTFIAERLQRLVQLCPPNLTYPMRVELVEDLGPATERGAGGFGSTGK